METNWENPKTLDHEQVQNKKFDTLWDNVEWTRETPIEAIAMVRLIRYLKRIRQMGVGRWPNVIFNEGMSERKKT